MTDALTFIDQALLDAAVAEARKAPRGRRNLNFHPHNDYPAHRLLNAIEPGSYVRPHCHAEASKDETIVCLRGCLGVVVFAADGSVTAARALSPAGPCQGVDIPHGVLHTVLALASGTVFLEAKAGPWLPLTANEAPDWAPVEGSDAAAAYLQALRAQHFPGV